MAPAPKKEIDFDKLAKARKGDAFYVKNADLYQALVDWYASGKEEIPDKIVHAIMQICERLSRAGNFVNYSFRSDMVQSAVVVCFIAAKKKKFNIELESKNPFSYFTQIAYNEMVRIIKEERRESKAKDIAMDQYITHSMLEGQPIEVQSFRDKRHHHQIKNPSELETPEPVIEEEEDETEE